MAYILKLEFSNYDNNRVYQVKTVQSVHQVCQECQDQKVKEVCQARSVPLV